MKRCAEHEMQPWLWAYAFRTSCMITELPDICKYHIVHPWACTLLNLSNYIFNLNNLQLQVNSIGPKMLLVTMKDTSSLQFYSLILLKSPSARSTLLWPTIRWTSNLCYPFNHRTVFWYTTDADMTLWPNLVHKGKIASHFLQIFHQSIISLLIRERRCFLQALNKRRDA